jgi:hypothetical protein
MRRTETDLDARRGVYIHWLENQLTSEGDRPDRSYYELVHVMFNIEFTWTVPMDDNRVADGMEIRYEFAELHGLDRQEALDLGPPSFIEVLLGLSRRLAFVAGGSAPRWAWELLVNLDLERMWDHLSRSKARQAETILETVINRDYRPDGVGGFFPLAWPTRDQREVELWYQLNAFAEERHPE